MPYIYFGQWDKVETIEGDIWIMPRADIGLGSIDLRNLPTMGQLSVNEGYGIFVTSARDDSIGLYLGSSVNDILTGQKLVTIKNSLELAFDITSQSIVDVLWELFIRFADITGEDKWRPLIPQVNSNLVLNLGGFSPIKIEKYNPIKHPLVIEQVKYDYKKIRKEFKDKGSEQHRRVLDYLSKKYKIDWKVISPNGEAPLPHQTTISDNFDGANSDTMGVQLSWTELAGDWDIISNRAYARTASSTDLARCDSDLSSDDHYAQIDWVDVAPTGGTIARKDSSTTVTFYHGRSNGTNLQLYKFVAGAATQLGSDVAQALSAPDTFKLEANGSTITLYYNGVSKISQSDTAITANTRTGLRDFLTAGWDNFVAEDLAAPVTVTPGKLSLVLTFYAPTISGADTSRIKRKKNEFIETYYPNNIDVTFTPRPDPIQFTKR